MKQKTPKTWYHRACRVALLPSLFAAALLAAHEYNTYGGTESDEAQLSVLPQPSGPGSVDLTFDPTAEGERVGLIGGSPYVNTVLPQPDGKVLIGGWFNGANGVLRNNLARLNEDGSLDADFQPGFGVDGEVSDLALQPDEKVVIIGSFSAVNVQPHALIARLNADGSVDATFNCRLAGDLHLRLSGLAVQSNGQIWIGGRFTNVNGVARANLARLNADGSLDTSFDPQFVVSGTNAAIHRIRVQADDKLLVSGTWDQPQRSLIRLNPDGSLDPGFGPVVALPSGYYEYIYDMFTHSDGTIAIAGTFGTVNGAPRPYAARLRANGTLDTSFNPSFGIRSAAGSVVIQPDGKIVVGGWFHEVSGTQRLGVARFNVDGSLDTSFDSANVIGRPPGTEYQPNVRALALQADGGLLVGAYPWWLRENTNSVFRLNSLGRRDPGFATLLQAPPDGVINMALQPDGKVVVGVVGDPAGLNWSSLLRLNPDGLVDESFHPDTNLLWMNALAVQPDGRILVNTACRDNTPSCPSLVRLLADGSVDPSFQAPPIWGFDQGIETFAVQPDGKILVGGLILEAGGLPYGGIVRLHSDGQLDSSFRPVPISVGDDIGCGVEHILVLPGGKILIAGGFTWDTGDYAPVALALLHADGTLDSNFLANIPAFEFVGSVALQADGKLLVSGTLMDTDGTRREDFVRLNADGTEDPTFQPAMPGEVGSLIVQADGRILAISGSVPNGIVRLQPDGSLDPTFQAPAGLVTEAYWNAANRMILQPDGQVLVSGAFHSANGIPVHGIVRLNNDIVPPSVALISPANGAVFQRPALIPLVAEASDVDGRVVTVEFFSGHTSLGQVTAPLDGQNNSFQLLWTNTLTGFYEVTAVATDNQGNSSRSAPSIVRVVRTRTPPRFTITDLGALESDGGCYPRAINNAGEVVGTANVGGSGHAFRYRAGQMTDLGTLTGNKSSAADINNAGVVAGMWMTGDLLTWSHNYHAFIWSNGVMQAVPEPSETVHLLVFGINDAGAMAGMIRHTNGDSHGVVWERGELRVLPNFPSGHDGYAIAINSSGLIAGHLADPSGEWRAVRFAGDDIINLGVLPGCLGSVAHNLNEAGQTVGYSYSADTSHGFLYANGTMTPLPMLPGGAHLYPNGINNSGQIAGSSHEYADGEYGYDSYSRAFLLRDGMIEDLNDLVVVDSAWVLTDATDLNDHGQIVGYGRHNGQARGWLLTPIVTPSFVLRQMSAFYEPVDAAYEIALLAQPPGGVSVYAVEDRPPPGWEVSSITHGGVFDATTGKVKFGPFFDDVWRTLSYEVTPPAGATNAQCFAGVGSADGADSPVVGPSCMFPHTLHPADTTSPGWTLGITEVTAYAAAWRRGETWSLPPNPIPIDYVTRAAFLWRGGECYEIDSAATNAPTCWVNCGDADLHPALAAVSILPTVRRQMPDAFVPGEPLLITLALSPVTARAQAVEDAVPTGWSVSAISDGGEFGESDRKVKWGPFFDAVPRTLTYVVLPPAHATGEAAFIGAASFDGRSAAIDGASILRVGCRLALERDAATGQLTVRVYGQTDTPFEIWISHDLRTWTPLGVTITNGQPIPFEPAMISTWPQTFYRVQPIQ